MEVSPVREIGFSSLELVLSDSGILFLKYNTLHNKNDTRIVDQYQLLTTLGHAELVSSSPPSHDKEDK